jgi:hypothetical protein
MWRVVLFLALSTVTARAAGYLEKPVETPPAKLKFYNLHIKKMDIPVQTPAPGGPVPVLEGKSSAPAGPNPATCKPPYYVGKVCP